MAFLLLGALLVWRTLGLRIRMRAVSDRPGALNLVERVELLRPETADSHGVRSLPEGEDQPGWLTRSGSSGLVSSRCLCVLQWSVARLYGTHHLHEVMAVAGVCLGAHVLEEKSTSIVGSDEICDHEGCLVHGTQALEPQMRAYDAGEAVLRGARIFGAESAVSASCILMGRPRSGSIPERRWQ